MLHALSRRAFYLSMWLHSKARTPGEENLELRARLQQGTRTSGKALRPVYGCSFSIHAYSTNLIAESRWGLLNPRMRR